MAVLITGAGLLATHAAKALIDAGESVVFYDVAPSEPYIRLVLEDRPYVVERGDVLDLPQMLHVIDRRGVTGVVHTAAYLPETARDRPFMATRVTVEGTVNTLEAHRIAKLGRFVLCSTIGVYDMDTPSSAPWEEDRAIGPNTFYGCLKLSAEVIALHYQKDYGVDVMAPRYCPVYGLGQWYASAGAIFMATCVEGPAVGRPVLIDKPFANTSQYLYVEEAARSIAMCYAIKNPTERAINIGSGELHTGPQVIAAVQAAIPGARIEIDPAVWAASKDRKFVDQPYSMKRARTALGFTPRMSLTESVAHYAEQVRRRERSSK